MSQNLSLSKCSTLKLEQIKVSILIVIVLILKINHIRKYELKAISFWNMSFSLELNKNETSISHFPSFLSLHAPLNQKTSVLACYEEYEVFEILHITKFMFNFPTIENVIQVFYISCNFKISFSNVVTKNMNMKVE